MRRVDFKTDSYNVHLLQTDKYHEISFDIVFEKNLTQEDFIYRKLLLTVLYNSVYNSQKERQRQELKIYKPNYDFYQEIKGNVILYHFLANSFMKNIPKKEWMIKIFPIF